MNDGGNSLGGRSEARSVKDDQTEHETDNWKDFFGSESEDDTKIDHTDGKADQDEVTIRSGDEYTSAERPRERGNKSGQDEEDTQTALTT